ncbi:MAG: 1,4-dihydroxy-2-naphthoate polyprenyltransferase [Nocardioidaceae bacterium]
MATAAEWIEGARPRTLPAAVSPVVAGTGVAIWVESFVWWKALLCLVVAIALQVAVNYANDYSDGVRGTDTGRVGPLRLVGSCVASAAQVKAAAMAGFALAGVAGLVLASTTSWWLLLIGAVAMSAAWFYTGGSKPYGYQALGEVSVFVFFGLVAVVGTTYVQAERIPAGAWPVALALGALACAILVANNLRDIPTDKLVGKRTLAVVMGDRTSRLFYAILLSAAGALAFVSAATMSWWALLALSSLPLAAHALIVVRRGATGASLIPVLRDTGLAELVYAVGLCAGLLVSSHG